MKTPHISPLTGIFAAIALLVVTSSLALFFSNENRLYIQNLFDYMNQTLAETKHAVQNTEETLHTTNQLLDLKTEDIRNNTIRFAALTPKLDALFNESLNAANNITVFHQKLDRLESILNNSKQFVSEQRRFQSF